MIHLVTFSDSQMSRSRALCIESALKHGVDYIAGPHYFDPGIETRDGFTLEWLKSQPIYEQMGVEWWTQRGVGYWLWKPYIIDQVMSKLPDGDILIYADAGIEFVNDVRHIIDRVDQDVFLFGNNWEHAHWCKADVIRAITPRWGLHYFGKQAQASVIFICVSDSSRGFFSEWLQWCLTRTNEMLDADQSLRFLTPARNSSFLIDDSPSVLHNDSQFREHRHDQAILTTLAYREGIKLHYWPAMYNDGAFSYEKLPEYAGDTYPVLFHHHRRRDHEWEQVA